MTMHLYTDATGCIIVNEGAQPPARTDCTLPLQFQGRVHDIDFNDSDLQDIQSQIFRQEYASVPGQTLSTLLAMLQASTSAPKPGQGDLPRFDH